MRDGGGSGGSPAIKVDVNGLRDVADQVRSDNNKTLRPESAQVKSKLSGGVPFGAQSPSGYVYAAKQRYHESLVKAIDVLNQYVQAADILASAAERIAATYQGADAMSAARSADVEKALNEAIEASKRVQPGPGTGRNRAI